MRPGISSEMLERAGVRHVSADEAKALCGLDSSGLWLPYRNADGSVIRDGALDYGRLRLDQPRGDMKYYQAAGTTVHLYLPPGLQDRMVEGGDLHVIEGEFKSQALMEAGFPAVGISGFYGYAQKDGKELVPVLVDLIERYNPARILFCGDSDTATNPLFAHAAVRLANLVKPLPVWLPRIPLNGPGKGADDCRAAAKGTFETWWRERLEKSISVDADKNSSRLAVSLFEAEEEIVASLGKEQRIDLSERIVKMAASLEKFPLQQERIMNYATKTLGIRRSVFTKAAKSLGKAKKQTKKPEAVTAFYDPARKCYWIQNDRGDMIEITETSMQRHLMRAGFINYKDKGETPMDDELIRIQRTCDVIYAGPLAGYGVGLQEQCGQRILVTRPPGVIIPVKGVYPTIETFICDLFDDPDHPELDQIPYVLGWLKVACEALFKQQPRPGQALAIAGPRDCGKSLFQALITEIFGGRSAKPYRYMSGGTEFNGDLFAAEHLMIEDEVACTDIQARRHFGARIKDFTVNATQSCHGKNRPALSLKPFWRMTITLNDEPENLLILPPIDESLEDKIILLKAKRATLPADIGTVEGRQKYWSQLMNELPMFLDFLDNYQIHPKLHSGRFGVRHFHHPTLIAALDDMSPERRFLALIDTALKEKDHAGHWTGTATELERMLSESAVAYESRRLLNWNNAAGTYLGRLAKKLSNRVEAQRTNNSRQWTINPAHWILNDQPSKATTPGQSDTDLL